MVQRSAFSASSLSKAMRSGDSHRFDIDLQNDRTAIVTAAAASALAGKVTLSKYVRATIKRKPCVSYVEYETHLVLRTIANLLARRFRISTPSRDRIVGGVIEGLMDGSPMYVIRRDVTSFYEAIPNAPLREKLLFDTSLPRLVRHYLRSFFDEHCAGSERGLPRGVGLTAILVELSMQGFDRSVRSIPGVYRYFRYSDDMLIFCYKSPADVEAQIDSLLPVGMAFSPDKSSTTAFDIKTKGDPVWRSFEYLGYLFQADAKCRTEMPRAISVSISSKKVKKLKSRIMLSLKLFQRTPDATLLHDRLRMIAGNYRLHRRRVTAIGTGPYIRSGIYYNYRRCGTYRGGLFEEAPPPELSELDNFLHGLLWGRGSPFAAQLRALASQALITKFRSLSFARGFASRKLIRMPYARIAQVRSAWRNA